MKKTSRIVFWLAAVVVLATALTWLVLEVTSPGKGMELLARSGNARVEAVADAAAGVTFDEARKWPESAWTPWTGVGYLTTRHGDVIWLRVTLRNPDGEPLDGALADTSYFSDWVELWEESATGWRREVSGCAAAPDEKPLRARVAAFPLTVPARGERVVYLRVSDGYVAHTQLVWWARAGDFFGAEMRLLLVQSACFGALLALVLYNAVLWLRLRFEDTGYYVLMAGAGTAFNFLANGGLALAGIAVGSPWHETLIAASMGLGAVFMTKFTRVFLGTAELMPRADRWLRGWGMAMAGVAALTPGMLWMRTANGAGAAALAAALTDAICLATAATAWRRGARHARFFLAAFAFLVLAGAPLILSAVRGDVNSGVAMGLLIGRTLEMLLLSFAVADRFAQTQRKLIEETEQRRAIEAAYADELEVEVRERTRELAEANADKDRMIAVIGHDLRSPLTALTRTAEHLDAGDPGRTPEGRFIGEAVQMGRQMLLLIEDLVLWARLRAGTIYPAVHPVASLTEPVMALYRPVAERRGVGLRLADVPAGLRAKTDIVLAQTLVRNLVANATRFARSRVEVESGRTPDGVWIAVRDDGPGLPPEVAARFAADAGSPDQAGGGLGLRLCAEIGRALGARLRAEPVEGGGTEFSFTLPAAPGDRGEGYET